MSPLISVGPAGHGGIHPLGLAIVQRQDVVAGRFDQELPLQLGQLVGHLRGQIVGLGPVGIGVVQLPDVLVERGRCSPSNSQGMEWRVTAVQPSW